MPKKAQKAITVSLGEMKEIKAPPGSATVGSTWIETKVTYSNTGTQPVWIYGYSKTSPVYGIETRPHVAGKEKPAKWTEYGLGYCGTGLQVLKIDPGEKFPFSIALAEDYRGKDFRVSIGYYTDASAKRVFTSTSAVKRLVVVEKP